MTNTPPTQTTRTRRQLLVAGTSLGIAATAGCLGILDDQKPIKEVRYKPLRMQVSLRSDAGISKVNLIAPDGTSIGSKPVASGQTTVKLPLRQRNTDYKPLAPGKYKVVVEKDGNEKQTKTVELTRSATITNVSAVQKQDDHTDKAWAKELRITIKNTGRVPIRLTGGTALTGMAVGKNRKLSLSRVDSDAILKPRRKTVPAGQSGRFETFDRPLVASADEIQGKATKKQVKKRFCNGQPIPAAFRLTGTDGFQKTYKFTITYSGEVVDLSGLTSKSFGCTNVSTKQNSSQTTT